MTLADVQRLVLLSAIWGSSFIFFRVISPVLGPVWTAELRVLIAGLVLLGFAVFSRMDLQWRSRGVWYAIVGVLNSGIPFALIAFAQLTLTASMAAILNATTPMWSAIVGVVAFRDSFTPWKGLGLLLGFAGVVVLVGWSPLEGGLQTYLSVGAMLLATLSYGVASNLTKARLQGAPLWGMAVGSQLASSVALAPLVPFNLPRAEPTALVIACLLALAVVCTAAAYLLYFRLILDLGAVRSSTVTLLVPVFANVWGFVFLHEAVTPAKVVACAVILSGVGFIAGLLPVRRVAAA